MATIQEYAQLSEVVYNDDPQLEGWTRVAFKPSGGGWNDALQAAAFTKNGELVFAFKGTSQGMDVIADLKLGVGMNTSQFSEARQFVEATGFGSAGLVTVCGHSLGGAIAQVVGNRLRLRFATFNAPGVAVFSSRNLDQFATAMTTGTFALRVAGSVVGAFRHPMQTARDVGSALYRVSGINFRQGMDLVGSWGVHYGQVIDVPYGGIDPLEMHSISNFVETLGQHGYDQSTLADLLH